VRGVHEHAFALPPYGSGSHVGVDAGVLAGCSHALLPTGRCRLSAPDGSRYAYPRR